MALNFNGSTQYISRTSAVISTIPVTVAGWGRASNITASGNMFAIGSSSSDTPLMVLQFGGAIAGDPIRWLIRNSGGVIAIPVSATGYSAGTWTHAAGVTASTTSHTAYIDGAAGTTVTTDITAGTWTVNRTAIGVLIRTGTADFFPGDAAEVGVWNVALDGAEIAALAKGYSPLMIRPASLIAYWPVIGRYSPEIERIGGADLTLTNTPVNAAHPRIIYPRRRQTYSVAAAAPGGLSIPIAMYHYQHHLGA